MQDECWDTFPGVMNVGVGAGSPSMVENFELCPQISPYPLDRTITAPRTALLSPWTPTPHLPRHKSTFSTSPQLLRRAQTFSLSDCFVLWELSWSFPKGDAHSPQHTQGAAPQTTPFLCIFTLCTHWWCWWCWLKVVVMETPFFSFC